MNVKRYISHKFKQIDQFSQQVEWRLNDAGDTEYKSKIGSLMTLIMAVCVTGITVFSLIVMGTRERIQIKQNIDYGSIPDYQVFNSSSTDFYLAFGLSQYPVEEAQDLSVYGDFVASYTVLNDETNFAEA